MACPNCRLPFALLLPANATLASRSEHSDSSGDGDGDMGGAKGNGDGDGDADGDGHLDIVAMIAEHNGLGGFGYMRNATFD